MAHNRAKQTLEFLQEIDPVPANLDSLPAAQKALIVQRLHAEHLFQFKVHLRGKALRWLGTLPTNITSDKDSLTQAFKEKFINAETPIVIQQQLAKVKLEDDVDKFLDNLLTLGAKINIGPDALTRYLIDGLPTQAFKEHVMGTDSHTFEVYSQRAKLYFATQK